MPSTYTLISSNVLASSAASVTFSAIPATYTDLVIRGNTRQTTGTYTSLFYTFNSITSAYSDTFLDNVPQSSRDSSMAYGYLGKDSGSATTANTFGSFEFYIPNYAGSTNKPSSSFAVSENNDATLQRITVVANLLSNTAAITSVTMSASVSFAAGSSFYLYGIKSS